MELTNLEHKNMKLNAIFILGHLIEAMSSMQLTISNTTKKSYVLYQEFDNRGDTFRM